MCKLTLAASLAAHRQQTHGCARLLLQAYLDHANNWTKSCGEKDRVLRCNYTCTQIEICDAVLGTLLNSISGAARLSSAV